MPDWIHSRIYIRGNEEARNEITEANFNFETLAPCPEGTDTDEWYTTVYGTHVEGEPEIINEDYRDQICIVVSTAWNSPAIFCKWLMNHYDELWIKIVYEGEGAHGGVILLQKEDGEIKMNHMKWFEPYYNGEENRLLQPE